MITHIDQLDPDKTYTYADYLNWKLDEYVELIRGKLVRMSPGPSSKHQEISGNLFGELYTFLKGKPCRIFPAPFDVRLQRKENYNQVLTVVQPDICIVCDPIKIDEKGCNGAPDLIIEILSPHTSKKDVRDKFQLYEEAGVREYWVVDPLEKLVDVFILKDGVYNLVRKYVCDDVVPVNIFESVAIDMKDIFEE